MASSQSPESPGCGKSQPKPSSPSKGVQNQNQPHRQSTPGRSPAEHNPPTAPSEASDTTRTPSTPSTLAQKPPAPAPPTPSSQHPVPLLTKEDYDFVIALPHAEQGATMRELGIELVGKSTKERAAILELWLKTPQPDERDQMPEGSVPATASGVNHNGADKLVDSDKAVDANKPVGPENTRVDKTKRDKAQKKADRKAKKFFENLVLNTEADLSEQDEVIIAEYNDLRLEQMNTEGDGNCIYDAFAFAFWADYDKWEDVREEVRQWWRRITSQGSRHTSESQSYLPTYRALKHQSLTAPASLAATRSYHDALEARHTPDEMSPTLLPNEDNMWDSLAGQIEADYAWGAIEMVQVLADAFDVEIFVHHPQVRQPGEMSWATSIRGRHGAQQVHLFNFPSMRHWTAGRPMNNTPPITSHAQPNANPWLRSPVSLSEDLYIYLYGQVFTSTSRHDAPQRPETTCQPLPGDPGTPGSIESRKSSKHSSPDPHPDRSPATKKPRPSRIKDRLRKTSGEQLDRAIQESLAAQERANSIKAKTDDEKQKNQSEDTAAKQTPQGDIEPSGSKSAEHADATTRYRSPSDSLEDYEYYEALEREAEEREAQEREAARGASLQGANARSPSDQQVSADNTLFGDLGRGRGYDPSIEDFRNMSEFEPFSESAVSGRVGSRFHTPGRGNTLASSAGSSRLVANDGPPSA